ncbi:MAG: restriction endonuclease subunit S [Flavobacterium sp.]|nr:restriction endonuclease subunit S [Flavobacterium sp.]
MRQGWKEVELGSLIEITSSKRIYLSDYVDTGIPFYRSKEIIESYKGKDISLELFITEDRYLKIKKQFGVPQINDILITSVGTIGIPYQVRNNKPFYFKDGNLIWLKFPKKELDISSDYLYFLIGSDYGKGKLDSILIGSSQKALTISGLKKIKFNLPPLQTQRKIASILSGYDDLIENNLKRIKLLEEKAQFTYEEWFVKMRFPGYETAKFDTVTGLPKGWEKKMLSQISDYIGRGISPKYVEEDGFSIINQKCIRDNRVDKSFCRLTDNSIKILQDKVLQSFDILINSTGTGTLGRVAQILTVNELLTVDTHVTIVRAGENISKIFLGRSLEYNQERIEKLGKGATNQIELSRHDLGELIVIDLPTLELQNLYEIKFKPNYQVIDKLIIQNRLLKEARDILLPRLMTGMIDVEELHIETLQIT